MTCETKKCKEPAVIQMIDLNPIGKKSLKLCHGHYKKGIMQFYNLVEAPTKLFSIKQASKLLGVHTETLRRWDKSGRLKAVHLGTRMDRRYVLKDILSLL